MNNTLQNGFTILEYLAADADECSVKELAEHFSLPPSHICRLLKTLVDTGYVEQTRGSRKYRISLKILALSNARLKKLALRNVARPYMQKLIEELGEPVFLTANHHGFSLIVGTEYPQGFHGDGGLVIGQLHPVRNSACGKVCAAYAAEEELEVLLAENPEDGEKDDDRFREELAEIRRRGYSRLVRSETLAAVGAPVFNREGVLAGALGAILPHNPRTWSEALWQKYIRGVKASAESISFALGYPLNQ